MPSLKQRLQEERLLRLFAVGRIPHPVVIDLFGLSGLFDAFWIDQEHAGWTYQEVVMAVLAGQAHGLECFVRMAPSGYHAVTQNLEAGAAGVMAARVESCQQAAQFVQWSKFAPLGQRGFNTGGRDGHYAKLDPVQFAQQTNREQMVAIQIETLGALDHVEQIAALEGVDLLFVGPADLSQALGILGQWDHPRLWEAIAAVEQACQRHGKVWATVAPSAQFVQRAVEHGCRAVSFASTVSCLNAGLDALREQFAAWLS